MAVFTQVSEDQARALLERLNLGQLTGLRGIQGGIENTNYFLDTTQGHWVLTLFERLTAEQLPFYLELMRHLAANRSQLQCRGDGLGLEINGQPRAAAVAH